MRISARSEPREAVVTFRITKGEYAELIGLAQEQGDASIGSVMRVAVRQFLSAKKSESSTANVKDARAAL